MKVKDFKKYLNIICDRNDGKCKVCMMGNFFKEPSPYCPLNNSDLMTLIEATKEDEDDIFKKERKIKELFFAVKEYSLMNPICTRQDVFLENYPKTVINTIDGCIDIKPCQIEGEEYSEKKVKCSLFDCAMCRTNYWSAEIEE